MADAYVHIRGADCTLECLAPGTADSPAAPGAGEPDELAHLKDARRVTAIVPGDDVLLTHVRIPGRSERDIAQALPFALEDRLAQPVDELHFARGPRDADGGMPVAVVARSLMERWLGCLDEAGIRAQALIPDTLMLPVREGEWSVLCEDRATTVRTGPYEGFRAEPDIAVAVLGELVRARGTPAAVRVYCSPGASTASLEADAHLNGSLAVEPEPLALGAEGPPALNLLQGGFAPGGEAARSGRRWWPAAAVLVLALGAHIGLSAYEYQRLEQRRQALQASTIELFRRAFPSVHRLVNARLQAEQKLASLKARQTGNDEFLRLLLRSGQALKGREDLRLHGLSFRNGVLEMRLKAAAVQGLDRYKRRLAAAGLDADVTSADVTAGGVDGRLTVRRRLP